MISGSATATAQEAGISQQIPDAAEVVSVTIAMAPPGLFTRARLGEAGLLGYGCSFSSDSRNVAALIGVITHHLHDTEEAVGGFYLRNAVYLHLRGGATIRYTSSEAQGPDMRVVGWADDRRTGRGTAFMAQGDLLTDLRKWAEDKAVESKDAQWCMENR